jgi:hypothetical protein
MDPGPTCPACGPNGMAMEGQCCWWDWCCNNCNPKHLSLEIGAGFYYVQPFWDNNPAYAIQTNTPGNLLREQDFSFDAAFAPNVWLKLSGPSGLGVRGRFYKIEQEAVAIAINDTGLNDDGPSTTIFSAGPNGLPFVSTTAGDHLRFDAEFQLSVGDIELTQAFCLGTWRGEFGLGGRYAYLSQDYHALKINPDNSDFSVIHSNHRFSGFGPTACLELSRPIANTGFSLYGSSRGSLLYGTSKQIANRTESMVGNLGTSMDSMSSGDDLLPVLEMELGIKYGKNLGPVELFLQTGVVSQLWFGAGNASNNDQIIGATPTADSQGNLGFFGLSFQAGLRF